jgi:hypothetical protein
MSTLTKKILALLLTLALLTGSFFVLRNVNHSRTVLGLNRLDLPAQARPDLLTNVLLSVGRALAVDYLWIGLQKMQEEGRYFDANQRAEWLCQLQPHFTSVWIFQAWNMSYNISVAMTTGPDRWRWVKNGYELLRDRGIPLNPKSMSMYQQLAWIFSHKIGQLSDDMHWYYKIQLAQAMEDIIGWPEAKYDIMAKAPSTWDELVADPKMADFVAKLREFKIDPQEKFLYLLTHRNEYGEKVLALLDNPGNKEQKDLLEGFLRAQRLSREWKMDAKIIGELRSPEKYGPLDFRTPQAHAIYWSYKGFKVNNKDTSFDALNTDRVIYGALQELVRRGRFLITPEGMPLISPDVRFIPVVHRTYLSLGKKYAEAEKIPWDGTAGETFRDGHVNFLRKAIGFYYQFGDDKMTRKYWDIMTKMYPLPEYKIGMDKYIYKLVKEDIGSMSLADVNATVVMFLMQAYSRYAMGDDYSALAMERWAELLYKSYMKDRPLKEETGRMSMAPWKDLKDYAIKATMKSMPEKLQERLRARLKLPAPEPEKPKIDNPLSPQNPL